MKAEKTPSGMWRVRVPIDPGPDGKRHWKSITKPTRKEALMAAAESMKSESTYASGFMEDLCEKYIDVRAGVLSPSTVRNYRLALKRIQGTRLGRTRLSNVNSVIVQEWVSELSRDLSPKSVRNIYGLFSAAFSLYCPDRAIHVKMPQKVRPQLHTPSNDEVRKLIDYFRDDPAMQRAIYLAACGSLRRGELCALTAKDVDRFSCTISVYKDMVLDQDHCYVIKNCPKTDASNRIVPVPKAVIDMLPTKGSLIGLLPDQVSNRFARARRKLGLSFRFHDLRSYYVSILIYAGVDPKTIQDIGGWQTDHVMKQIYLRTIEEEKQKQIAKIRSQFDSTILSGL